MKLQGALSITYPFGGEPRDVVALRITDVASGAHFVELEISFHDFTAALSTRSSQPCALEVRGLGCVGKRREVKTIAFQMSIGKFDRDTKEYKQFISMIEAEEKEGWQGDVDGALRTQQPHGVTNVVFRRWVEQAERSEH
jgi:hypothetical protein